MNFAFDSIAEFVQMGGHGLYVWLAYGATYLVLGVLLWQSLAGHRVLRARIRAQQLRQREQQ
jgi:heme exporter protein D